MLSGDCLPDAGLLLLYRKSVSKRRRAVPRCVNLRDIWRNDQWRVVSVLTILNILAVCVRGGAMMYYHWIMGSAAVHRLPHDLLRRQPDWLGAGETLTDWKCKVSVFWWTNALTAVLSVAMFFVPMDAEITMFVFIFVIGVLPAGDANPVGNDVRHRR